MTYNSADTLRRFWRQTRPPWVEWIVVDNRSTDDSGEVATMLGAKVISEEINRGFSRANNVGFLAARGPYVAFVNPDVEVDWGSLPYLASRLEGSPRIIAPQLVNPDGSLQPNGRGAPTLLNKILNRLRPAKPHPSYRLYADEGEERYVAWLIGAAVVARRDTFAQLAGPWNDHYFLYYEDADLSLRAWAQGIPVVLVGGARWTHGWARATSDFRVDAWKREIASMTKFYTRYPRLLVSLPAGGSLREARTVWGSAPEARSAS